MPTDKLEQWFADRLAKYDVSANITINSGAIKGDEDVISESYIVQCKRSSIKRSFIVTGDDWKQLQMAVIVHKNHAGNYRTGLFVNENKDGDRAVTIEVGDFLYMLSEIKRLSKTEDDYKKLLELLERSGVDMDDVNKECI